MATPRDPSFPASPAHLTRRELLAGAGAGAAALLLDPRSLHAHVTVMDRAPQTAVVAFTHTIVANPDAVQNDVTLVVEGDRIAAIGDTDTLLARYPQAQVYDGRGKALFPGLVNTHGHMAAVLERGFNEDFGYPNTQRPSIQPASLLQGGEGQLMVQVAALEAIRTGTTTMVEFTGNIAPNAEVLANTGLRLVLAESVRDAENVAGPMSPAALARSEAPRFSPQLRDQGMQRINDLFSAWHGQRNDRVRVFPATQLTEAASPELLQALRAFAEQHDLGYTIHLDQSRAEAEFALRWHGVRPAEYLDRAGFLGPRLFAAHARYVNTTEIELLGRTRTIIAHQASMAGNRGVSPPIPALRAAGCPIALGTDNNTNDVFEVMRVALLTERIRRGEDEIPGLQPQPEDMLADAAQGGARAVRQEQTIGTLEVGKKADILVVDTLRPHLQPYGRIVSALIHCGHPDDIESVMIDGVFVMRDHRVTTMDEDAIVREADAVGRRIWGRVLEASPLRIPRLPRPT
jgi:cytosine/adenosine deaminase-related metal-dependent hydrolase